MNREKVVLVNEEDIAIGEMDKLEAHEQGRLHRAFSVFLFNEKGEVLLQQRAQNKYHGAGLWTNACCSHPGWKDDVKKSALERLSYEMGISCNLEFLFSFIYKAPVENNLTEHEFDHVFFGTTSGEPHPNIQEVQAYKWMRPEIVLKNLIENPEQYTVWFRKIFKRVLEEKQDIGKDH